MNIAITRIQASDLASGPNNSPRAAFILAVGFLTLLSVLFSALSAGASTRKKSTKKSAGHTTAAKRAPAKPAVATTPTEGPSADPAPEEEAGISVEDSNNFIGNPDGLYRFYRKLDNLRRGRRLKVNILHIGDSHIQADFMTATTRKLLQAEFGNAGRGLVFPYDLVRTNGPTDYAANSNLAWCSDRNVARTPMLPTGISGMVLQSDEPNSYIRFFLKGADEQNYDFNQVTLFYEKGEMFCDLVFFDSANHQIGYISPQEEMHADNRFSTTITFPAALSDFTLYAHASSETQRLSRLYGIVLENGQNGIRYDVVGVNGAEYRHYAAAPYFFQQTAELNPDLVIISLGTNDAFVNAFSLPDFVNSMDSVVMQIKQVVPDAAILLTIPPDSLRRSHVNYNLSTIRRTIINYCRENNFAYWDLLSVMGGLSSIRQWASQGMAQRDNVHFTRTGYQRQGKLLFEALMKGYDQYGLH